MRIRRTKPCWVAPDFISNLRARGMQNLTIDQLVNLRIHGID